MARVLVLFAHPAIHQSRVNARLIEAARAVDGVTVHDLYEAYPDFFISSSKEQGLLLEHDVIIWQHPFYWYSSPALLKEWVDVVLQRGFAYGEGGTALAGKVAMSAITTGGGADSYSAEGFNHFTIRQFLAPFEQTARLCGMTYQEPFLVHSTHSLSEAEIRSHSERYTARLKQLAAGATKREERP